MKFGFDLDSTLDRPEIAEIARCLYAAGHSIHIVTAAPSTTPLDLATETKTIKLARLNVPFTHLKVVQGPFISDMAKQKAEYVQLEQLEFFIDDMFDFCLEVRELNKTIPVCHLWG